MDDVLAANRAFYAAFEARDIDALADLCVRDERATVTHPGWATLRGWGRVLASWDAIFRNTASITFVLTDEVAVVHGDAAWVTLDEHILQSHGAGSVAEQETSGARVAATNVFVREDGTWRLVLHHGSPVAE